MVSRFFRRKGGEFQSGGARSKSREAEANTQWTRHSSETSFPQVSPQQSERGGGGSVGLASADLRERAEGCDATALRAPCG